jgi:hypothetical protein
MSASAWLRIGASAAALALLGAGATRLVAQTPGDVPAVDTDDIGGVLTGPNGPEAGVWVIAETKDLKTRFLKVVVTDDKGRFVVPDLPAGGYSVWARGYGLADSAKVNARPGQVVRLAAKAAASSADAAKVYPAAYWYSMLKIPAKGDFAPGRRPDGMGPQVRDQEEWLTRVKNGGCVGCHQMGNLATRTIPAAFRNLGSSQAAWTRRILSGQAGADMTNSVSLLGPLGVQNFADWTDRIAAGELPKARPERPQGIERNVVVTVWDWLDDKHYLHDLISTDKRNPTVNAGGPLYGATELSVGRMPVLDPKTNTATAITVPVREPDTPIAARATVVQPSAYWGAEAIWDSRANVHNQMFDQYGRVWSTATVRGPDNPAFCKAGSSQPSAKAFPNDRAARHLSLYDPRDKRFIFIDTCYSTHHPQFDKNDVLWTSGGGPVLGWLDTKVLDATGDAAQAQGWTPIVLDTNGNGRRDAYTEPGQPADPKKDMRVNAPFYAVMPSPVDNAIWGAVFRYPGSVVRVVPNLKDPGKSLAEVYDVPLPGFGVRGGDIDSKGVVWVSLGSGHLGSFDRRKCKGPLRGPKATGGQCPEGWSFYRLPGPSFESVPGPSVEASYYTWVDQHDTLGLGKDVPIVTGNLFDGFHALVNGKFVTLRLPYPLGFYAKGLDGRIDDPKAGWKGRGLWSSSGDRVPWHMEGGKGTKPLAVHMQVRPDPLAH